MRGRLKSFALKIALTVTVVMLLSACSQGGGADMAKAVRDYYSAIQSCTLRALITADYADYALTFDLQYAYAGEEVGGEITVLAPEEIAGIRAQIGADGRLAGFEGDVLETGQLPGTVLSPIEALPALMRAWRGGLATASGGETRAGTRCATVTWKTAWGGVDMELRAWFEETTLAPVYAEAYAEDGRCVLMIEFMEIG